MNFEKLNGMLQTVESVAETHREEMIKKAEDFVESVISKCILALYNNASNPYVQNITNITISFCLPTEASTTGHVHIYGEYTCAPETLFEHSDNACKISEHPLFKNLLCSLPGSQHEYFYGYVMEAFKTMAEDASKVPNNRLMFNAEVTTVSFKNPACRYPKD